jgi:predicted type IV restriction endonuclease
MSVQQVLENIRTQLPTWRTATLNEAQTSQVIILRLIQALGYDIWNPSEVFPQEAANGNIPDFIVLHDDARRFIVEVKKLDTPLTDRMKTQAVSYANNQAIQWAILTNGAEWLLFDSFMVSQPAHNRLVLSLSLDNHDVELLAQYFERLLAASVWSKTKDYVAKTAQDIHSHIALNQQLQPLARELIELMDEYTIQDADAALKLAEKLSLWDTAKHTLATQHQDLLKQLLGSTDAPTTIDAPAVASHQYSSLIDAIKQGINQTAPTHRRSSSSELQAFIGDEALDAINWRDIFAGITESFLVLGKVHEVAKIEHLYESTVEKRKSDGRPYPKRSYRQLSNSKYLYVAWNMKNHYRKSKKLLENLGVPDKTIKVVYKGDTYFLP